MFFRSVFILVGLFLLTAQNIYADGQRMYVSVSRFESQAGVTHQQVETLRSRITDNIVNTRKFNVVERQSLENIVREASLSSKGLTDGSSAPRTGMLRSAYYVIDGSVLSLGVVREGATMGGVEASKGTAMVELQLRITSVETGRILASKTIISRKSQADISGSGMTSNLNIQTAALEESIRDAARKVTEALMDLAYPAKIIKVQRNDVLVNLAQEQTELGAIYDVFAPGEEIIDPDTKASLGSSEEFVGQIEIVRRAPKFATAKPLGSSDISYYYEGMIIRRQDAELVQREMQRRRDDTTRTFEKRF